MASHTSIQKSLVLMFIAIVAMAILVADTPSYQAHQQLEHSEISVASDGQEDVLHLDSDISSTESCSADVPVPVWDAMLMVHECTVRTTVRLHSKSTLAYLPEIRLTKTLFAGDSRSSFES